LVSYRQLSSGQVVLHERETTSSGRPKATLASEDEFYKYDQTRSGVVTKRGKTNLEHYIWWHNHNVKFDGQCRQTPLTEWESAMGVRNCIPSFRYHWCAGTHRDGYTYGCQGGTFNETDWEIFKQTHTIDYGALEIIYKSDIPKRGENWQNYFRDKAGKLNLEIVGEVHHLNFREKQKPAVVEKLRPIPKEVEKLEPVEVEPIKEVVKYSPLMIAGVIAVIVIILWRRA